jgi:hypothetical protein
MAITGGIKFFNKSTALAKDGATATVTSGDASALYALSMNKYIRWDSVGSTDLIWEEYIVNFTEPTTINRLFLVSTNIKEFDIYYNTSLDFTNVLTLNGPTVGIHETNNTLDTLYYEFDSVTVNNITIRMQSTQTPNQQKFITLIAPTNELGTLEGYPQVTPNTDQNDKLAKTQNGKYITQKGFEVFDCSLTYEYTNQADVTLFKDLYEIQNPFLIWLCGGRFGTEFFSVEFSNWRLQDLFQVQTTGKIKTTFANNVYTCAPQSSLKFVEEV